MTRYIPLLLPLLLAADPVRKDTSPASQYLRDHAETRGFMLGRPAKAQPTPDGQAVLFLRSEPRVAKLALYEFDVASKETRKLLTPSEVLQGAEEKLSPEEKARRERMRVSVGGFTGFQLDDSGAHILLQLSGKLYVVTRANRQVRELKTGDGTIVDPKFSPDGSQVGYVKDHDVFVFDLAKDQESRVTNGGTAKKTHGLAEFVAQEEMGRHSGWWWSPDGKHIAYEEADADGVEVWYVADPAKPGQEPHPFFYPRPGKKNVRVRLGVIPVTGGETVWIDWDCKKYEYLAMVRWDKHGPLTIGVQNRLQDRLLLLSADLTTGKTATLLEFKAEPKHWINLDEIAWRWLANGKLLCANRGFSGYSLDIDASMKERFVRIADTHTHFQELVDVDDRTGTVLYQATESPTEAHIYYVRPNQHGLYTGKQLLTTRGGVHYASGNGKLVCITSSTLQAMPRTMVVRPDGTVVGELPSVAETPTLTPNVKVEFMAPVPLGFGADTLSFHAAIIRPRDFDAKKKYPVVVYVYGGPTHAVVTQSQRAWLLPQWLADQGFIVVAIDNRGTPGRGTDWEKAVYQRFGSVPLGDQVFGLQTLGRQYPELDLERVGIYGWSFGGYMSGLAVLKRPDIYKAAVAGAPVTDWEDYDTHYTERYLGLPQDSPEAYKDASLLTYATSLKRPLLLIHGTADDNVYFRHSLKLADALFRNGQECEILPLAGLTHMVPEPVVMENLYRRIAGHFHKHLGAAK